MPHGRMSEGDASRLASGALVGLVARISGRVVHLASQIFIARTLGPAEFGAFALAFTVLRMMGLVTPLGMPNAVLRFGAEARAANDAAAFRGVVLGSGLCAAMAGGVVAALVFWGAPWLAANVFDKPELATVFRAIAPGIAAIALVRVTAALLRSLGQTAVGIIVEDSLAPVVLIAVWVGAVAADLTSVEAAAMAVSVGVIGACAVGVVLGWRSLGVWRQGQGVTWPGADLLAFALASAFAGVFNMYLVWVLRLIIARELPLEALGIYQAASQASVLFAVILSAFAAVLGPMIAEAVAGGQSYRAATLYRLGAQWGFVCGAPALLLLFLAPAQILGLVYGAEFAAAGPILRVLLFGQAVNLATGSVGVLLVLLGKERAWLGVSMAGFAVVVAAGLAVTARFGVAATAWVETVGLSFVYLGGVAVLVRSGYASPFDAVLRRLVTVIVGTAAVAQLLGALLDLPDSGAASLGLAVVASLVGLGGCLRVMQRSGDPQVSAELKAQLLGRWQALRGQ